MADALAASVRVVFNRLPAYQSSTHAALVTAIATGGADVQRGAMRLCPVLTGTLRRSIHVVVTNAGLTATIGPSVDYGVYVEYGTRHRGARPYLRPAFESVKPRVIAEIRAILGKAA